MDGQAEAGCTKRPSHLPYHPHGEFMEGSLFPSWVQTTLSPCQEAVLGFPRQGGGLEAGLTAALQERER